MFLEERNRADQVIHDIDTKLDEYKDQLDADEVNQLKEDAASVSQFSFLQPLTFLSVENLHVERRL